MAKSYTALAAVACVLTLAFGCGGNDSVASKSARAFREAQQRGDKLGGDGHAHGHGALSPENATGDDAGAHAGMEHGADAAGTSGRGATPDHSAMAHEGGPSPGTPADHAAMGHAGMAHGAGQPGQSGGQSLDHAAMGHAGGTPSPQTGAPTTEHSTMGHGPGPASPSAAAAPDHAAMGHGTGASAQSPTMGSIQTGTVVPPAGPVPPGAPAATLAADPLDAPAATSVVEAQRAAAMANEMSGESGHGGHGGSGTYRHVDAGRDPEASDSSEDDGTGDAPEHAGHGAPADPPASGHGGHAATPEPSAKRREGR